MTFQPEYGLVVAKFPIFPPTYEAVPAASSDTGGDAFFDGLTAFGIPRLQEKTGQALTVHNKYHECGHVLDALLDYWSTTFPGWHHELFWTFQIARGVVMPAASWAAAGIEGNRLIAQGAAMMTWWGVLPGERWAECFAAAMEGSDSAALEFFTALMYEARPLLKPKPAPPAPVVVPPPPPPAPEPEPTAELRYCFDSTNARDIPAGAAIVAGYVDGLYKWSDADWQLFPGSVKVRIACFVDTDDGHVGDVERGDMTPSQAPYWVAMRRAAGIDPTIYCGLGAWDAVRAAFRTAGIPEPHYWIAHYDNDPTPIDGAVAKQYANPTFTGHHYDASVVAGRWPGVEGDEEMDPDALNRAIDARIAENAELQNTITAVKAVLEEQHAAIVKLAAGETIDDAELAALKVRVDKLRDI